MSFDPDKFKKELFEDYLQLNPILAEDTREAALAVMAAKIAATVSTLAIEKYRAENN